MASILILYLGLMAVGIVIGSKKLPKDKEYPWIGKIQYIALLVLIGTLGIKLGADEQVVSSLGDIGVSAFVIAMVTMVSSMACVHVVRKWMKIDGKGVRKHD